MSASVGGHSNILPSHVKKFLGQTSNTDFSHIHVQQFLGQPHESPSIGAAGPTGGSSEVRAVLANRCLESTAIVARATARLMHQKDPIFEKPPRFNPSSDTSPRQALATDIMDLLNYTKTLATRSALHPLTAQQSKHLECAENFGKCLERYCQPGKSGSDLSLLLLTRSILGHLDQVIATTMLDPIEVTKANLKDSTNWEVFEAIKDRASGDIGLRTIIPNEKTAIHAILYGGNSVGSQSTPQHRPILLAPVQQHWPHTYYPVAQQTTNPALLPEVADAAVVVDSTQPQTASFKEIKTAFDTVASALKQYIGSKTMDTAEDILCSDLSEASIFIGGDELCQDVPKWIESIIKEPMKKYIEQKLPSEVSKLPSRFEKAVQAALDNPQISYDKLKILLYGDRPLEIDGGAPLPYWERWKRTCGMG